MITKMVVFGLASSLLLAGNLFGQPSGCTTPPSGLMAWWQAEGNANDAANLDGGTLDGNVDFMPGEVGQAFNFSGTNSDVHIPASASLDVGAGSGFTIEGWINPASISQPQPLLQWNTSPFFYYGVSLWISLPPTNGGSGPGCFSIDVNDYSSGHNVASTGQQLVQNTWQYVAATYDTNSGTIALYINGVLLTETNIGIVTPATRQDLWLGYEHDQIADDVFSSIGNGNAWYGGQMDEISIYNRALSSAEIQAIYNAGSSGKCALPPTTVVIRPADLTAAEGETAKFAAAANGSSPLTLQWQFDGTNILDATNNLLVLTNVQESEAGDYTVEAINLEGTNVSSSASLTVLPSYSPLWVQTSAPTNFGWTSLACSADGKKIVAASYIGSIYTSDDGGITWISNDVPQLAWSSLASSADGTKLVAAAESISGGPSGAIWGSTNSGANWQLYTNLSTTAICSSADGNTLAFLAYNPETTYVSTNSGVSWIKRATPPATFASSLAGSSADISKLYAIVGDASIWVSTNLASTWVATAASTNYAWFRMACSVDGSKIAVAPLSSNLPPHSNYEPPVYDPIFTSTNAGNSWTVTGSPSQEWNAIAGSSDGEKLVAGVYGGYLYVSTDGGNSWMVTRAPSANWSALASSSDGTRLVAAMWPGSIYIWHPTALSYATAGDNLVISWPTNDPAFVLQENTSCSATNWVDVTNVPVITNEEYQVVIPTPNGSEFFRLAYP